MYAMLGLMPRISLTEFKRVPKHGSNGVPVTFGISLTEFKRVPKQLM